ncbi:MAG: hypothetical protein HY335_03230, partial [Deinococcus sp.]|nr:hypothetical protein [Deinococcus sp.]
VSGEADAVVSQATVTAAGARSALSDDPLTSALDDPSVAQLGSDGPSRVQGAGASPAASAPEPVLLPVVNADGVAYLPIRAFTNATGGTLQVQEGVVTLTVGGTVLVFRFKEQTIQVNDSRAGVQHQALIIGGSGHLPVEWIVRFLSHELELDFLPGGQLSLRRL